MTERDDSDRVQFFAEVDHLRNDVFSSHPEIVDHRSLFPWLTGCLGDPLADVWFVAENPSLTQVRKVRETSREAQWSVSPGDKLFRQMLVKHHFKEFGLTEPGGWHCYITDVIKSAAVVKDWNESSAEARRTIAEAWAPVLRYELEAGRPKLLVMLGRKTRELLDHLLGKKLLPRLPARKEIYHYSYIASRPDSKHKGLGPLHPERVAEWDGEFAQIAQMARASLDR